MKRSTVRPPQELLYDSEASLRLVDHAIKGVLDRLGDETPESVHGRMTEPSSSFETATTRLLDGLSRAVTLVERFDAPRSLADDERREIAASLREELRNLANHLQAWDIASR